MKIGQGTEAVVAASAASLKKAEQDKSASPAYEVQQGAYTPASAASAGASVSVSALARSTLEQVDRSGGSEFDGEKVAQIRAAIQNGTYKVNAEAIADRMLANAQEMLNVVAR